MSETRDVTIHSGVGFPGWCFILFINFDGRQDLYGAIMHWLLK